MPKTQTKYMLVFTNTIQIQCAVAQSKNVSI